MVELNDVQRKAIDVAGEAPPRVVAPESDRIEVLLKSADFDWIRGILNDEPDAPRLIDSRTRQVYALVPVERYERFAAFFEEDLPSPEERQTHLEAAGKRAGWDDPAFDVYDEETVRP